MCLTQLSCTEIVQKFLFQGTGKVSRFLFEANVKICISHHKCFARIQFLKVYNCHTWRTVNDSLKTTSATATMAAGAKKLHH